MCSRDTHTVVPRNLNPPALALLFQTRVLLHGSFTRARPAGVLTKGCTRLFPSRADPSIRTDSKQDAHARNSVGLVMSMVTIGDAATATSDSAAETVIQSDRAIDWLVLE